MTDAPNERSAISDRREQIGAADRPQRLSDVSIKDAVGQVRETEDLVKLYRSEWICVRTSQAKGADGQQEIQEVFGKKYEGRVRPEDVRFDNSDQWASRLMLRLPNVRGEFKTRDLAEAHAKAQGWGPDEIDIVARNSRAEYALKDYSVKKLLA